MNKPTKYILIGGAGILIYQAYRTAMALMNLSYWITGCSIYSITLQTLVIRLGLQITNTSSQALMLQDINTVFYMDGEQVGYVFQGFPANQLLTQYANTNVTIDCNINTMDIVSKVYQTLVAGSQDWKSIQFRTVGTIKANGIAFPIDITTPITDVVPKIFQ